MANDGRIVGLTQRYRRFIDAQVETGRHANSSEVVREALRRYERDIEAEQAAIEAIWALAHKSVAGEAAGDLTDIHDATQLGNVMDELLNEALERERGCRTG